jgi:hypothetical protein
MCGTDLNSVAPPSSVHPVGFTNLIMPPGRTRESHYRDDRDAGYEPRPTPSPPRGRSRSSKSMMSVKQTMPHMLRRNMPHVGTVYKAAALPVAIVCG